MSVKGMIKCDVKNHKAIVKGGEERKHINKEGKK